MTETYGLQIEANFSESESHLTGKAINFDVMEIVQLSIAPVGIIGNLTVMVVFLNHKKLRRKIPNRFIVNQVRNFILIHNRNVYDPVSRFSRCKQKCHMITTSCGQKCKFLILSHLSDSINVPAGCLGIRNLGAKTNLKFLFS